MGKTASAWVSFKDAAEIALRRHDPRQAIARGRASALERKLSKLTIVLAPGPPTGLELTDGGVRIGAAAAGSALPVDPGTHLIVVSAPGYVTWRTSVNVKADGDLVRVDVPPLEPGPANAVPSASIANAAEGSPAREAANGTEVATSDQDGERRRSAAAQRRLGYIVAGAGVAGIGVGSVFGLLRNAKVGERDAVCATGTHCTPEEAAQIGALTDEARARATVATVGFVVGAVGLVGGALLLISAHDPPSSTAFQAKPWLGSGVAGVVAGGEF
jgi:hypothetical protein